MSDTVELLGFRRCSPTSGDRSHFPLARSSTSKRRLYRRGFCLTARLSVDDREPRADREGGELIDRVAARTPVRELFLIQPLGHARQPFAGVRADHRAGIKPAAIDTHRAAEAAADLEGGLDDGVASQARDDRLEIGDFPGRTAVGHSVPPRSVKGRARDGPSYMGCPEAACGP